MSFKKPSWPSRLKSRNGRADLEAAEDEWEAAGHGGSSGWCCAPQVERGTPEEAPGRLGKEEGSHSERALEPGPFCFLGCRLSGRVE